jgi:hypothetical protein
MKEVPMVTYRVTIRLTTEALRALENRRWRFQRANRGKTKAEGLAAEVQGLLQSLDVLPEDARVRCHQHAGATRRRQRR